MAKKATIKVDPRNARLYSERLEALGLEPRLVA